jgi:2-C-methyl-D-erythritol 2,4-cyclodiphosphate synthase
MSRDNNPIIGHGYDRHRLEAGHKLILGGVEIDFDKGCDAHSDGDVLAHALTDALLGSIGQPDIGQLYPNDDPKWKDADSSKFVKDAFQRVFEAGYVVGNIDITVLLEQPKLVKYKKKMRENVAYWLTCQPVKINIKGKTGEGVGPIGRGEAIDCHAVILMVRIDW